MNVCILWQQHQQHPMNINNNNWSNSNSISYRRLALSRVDVEGQQSEILHVAKRLHIPTPCPSALPRCSRPRDSIQRLSVFLASQRFNRSNGNVFFRFIRGFHFSVFLFEHLPFQFVIFSFFALSDLDLVGFPSESTPAKNCILKENNPMICIIYQRPLPIAQLTQWTFRTNICIYRSIFGDFEMSLE